MFTALTEADDTETREAITGMYRRFHERLRKLIDANRQSGESTAALSPDAAAWSLIGLATVSNIVRELELWRPRPRKDMFAEAAKYLVEGCLH